MKLKDFARLIRGKRCRWCGARLPTTIEHYDHAGGWTVEGFKEKQWLYVTCRKCKYQWALWKLGVPREPKVEEGPRTITSMGGDSQP